MFVTFGYAYDAPGVAIELSPERVFACRNVVVVDRSDADFAVVELERPARIAPPVRSERPLAAGDTLVVASYPSGLPLKVEVGATVLDAPPGRSAIRRRRGSSRHNDTRRNRLLVRPDLRAARTRDDFEGTTAAARPAAVRALCLAVRGSAALSANLPVWRRRM
jgi:hypothetical protein